MCEFRNIHLNIPEHVSMCFSRKSVNFLANLCAFWSSKFMNFGLQIHDSLAPGNTTQGIKTQNSH